MICRLVISAPGAGRGSLAERMFDHVNTGHVTETIHGPLCCCDAVACSPVVIGSGTRIVTVPLLLPQLSVMVSSYVVVADSEATGSVRKTPTTRLSDRRFQLYAGDARV